METEDLPMSRQSKNNHPENWLEILRDAEERGDYETKEEMRERLKELDSGRFYEFLDATHKLVAYADLSNQKYLTTMFSNRVKAWLTVFGYCEDLNRLEDF